MKLSKLKVFELRKELDARGLDSSGTRPVLMKRLREAMDAAEAAQPTVSHPLDVEHPTQAAPTSLPQAARAPEPELAPEPEPEVEREAVPEPEPEVEMEPQQETVVQASNAPQEEEALAVEDEAVVKPVAVTGSLAAASQASIDERIRLRRERFGFVPPAAKRKEGRRRVARGDALQNNAEKEAAKVAAREAEKKEQEAMKRRALKFGLTDGKRESTAVSPEEMERRLKRQRRFQAAGPAAV